MNELDMCKAIAEIEGVIGGDINWGVADNAFLWTGNLTKKYNPIRDLALNCALRDKYKVEVEYWRESVAINEYEDLSGCALFGDAASVCHAVIECILKANGKYTK